MEFSKRLDKRLNEAWGDSPSSDFTSKTMRRIDGALAEIQYVVSGLSKQIEELKLSNIWDAEPESLVDYAESIRMIEGMLGRLKNPNY